MGLQSLSMRALAEELGVNTGTLYGHVADIEEIRDLVVERLVTDHEWPSTDGLDVRSVLVDFGLSMRQLLRSHPGLERQLRHRLPQQVVAHGDDRIRALLDRDIDPGAAILLSGDVPRFVLGYESLIAAPPHERQPEPRDPMVVAAYGSMRRFDVDDEFEWALRAHVDGLVSAVERNDLPPYIEGHERP